jgi:hypothetical protein
MTPPLLARLPRARAGALAIAASVALPQLGAQSAPKAPIRTLAPSTAVSTDSVGSNIALRALSDGRVMVNDLATRRVLLFDATLTHAKVVIDTLGGTGPDAPTKVQAPANTLIRYMGDTTLYADRVSQSLLVIDPTGKVARVMSLPKPSDIVTIGAGGEAGTPGFDSQGRLVYHGVAPRPRPLVDSLRPWLPPIPVQVDSAPIVRADLDRRVIDTLMNLKLNIGAPFKSRDVDNDGNVIMRMYINTVGVDDQWAYLSDGTVAVLSVHDYHLEWWDPDGKRRSTPKMPFDWKRITDADRLRMIDSLRPELERVNSAAPITINTPNGPRTGRRQYEFLPPEKFGEYEQPVNTGAVKPDLNARLWILPRTSLSAKDGLLYDVINRNGELVERVQFPKGTVLAGFGDGGVVYVVRQMTVSRRSFATVRDAANNTSANSARMMGTT